VKDAIPPNDKQVSTKREEILEKAFIELRKARSKMSPAFLSRIRQIIQNSPALINKLGLEKSEVPNETKAVKSEAAQKEAVTKAVIEAAIASQSKVAKPKEPVQQKPKMEKIDQAKQMDVLSKLLEINPDKKR